MTNLAAHSCTQDQLVSSQLAADMVPLSVTFHNYMDAFNYGYVVVSGHAFSTSGGIQMPVYVCNPWSSTLNVPTSITFDAVMINR